MAGQRHCSNMFSSRDIAAACSWIRSASMSSLVALGDNIWLRVSCCVLVAQIVVLESHCNTVCMSGWQEILFQKAADVWKKEVWDFQMFSQTFFELQFSLGNEGKDGKNLNSQTWLSATFLLLGSQNHSLLGFIIFEVFTVLYLLFLFYLFIIFILSSMWLGYDPFESFPRAIAAYADGRHSCMRPGSRVIALVEILP